MINKGDILLANMDPASGNKLKKVRPVLVVSKNHINKYTQQLIVIPFTSKLVRKKLPDVFFVKSTDQNGLKEDSILHGIQIRSVSKKEFSHLENPPHS